VYATDGDDTLGGSDIDLCLFKILKDRIHEAYGVDIAAAASPTKTGADSSEEEAEDSANMCSAAAVHTKAEEIKKALTYVDQVQFNCTLPSGDKVCVAWS
jgi:molecular chaperone DnaK (HSP70)